MRENEKKLSTQNTEKKKKCWRYQETQNYNVYV